WASWRLLAERSADRACLLDTHIDAAYYAARRGRGKWPHEVNKPVREQAACLGGPTRKVSMGSSSRSYSIRRRAIRPGGISGTTSCPRCLRAGTRRRSLTSKRKVSRV